MNFDVLDVWFKWFNSQQKILVGGGVSIGDRLETAFLAEQILEVKG
jgi:hypothetical protein